jgi:hypothetical protein
MARHPAVELGLGTLEVFERAPGEELLTERAVEALDLPGGLRAPGGGEQVVDAVLAADPVEQDLDVFVPEAAVGRRGGGSAGRPAAGSCPGA